MRESFRQAFFIYNEHNPNKGGLIKTKNTKRTKSDIRKFLPSFFHLYNGNELSKGRLS